MGLCGSRLRGVLQWLIDAKTRAVRLVESRDSVVDERWDDGCEHNYLIKGQGKHSMKPTTGEPLVVDDLISRTGNEDEFPDTLSYLL